MLHWSSEGTGLAPGLDCGYRAPQRAPSLQNLLLHYSCLAINTQQQLLPVWKNAADAILQFLKQDLKPLC